MTLTGYLALFLLAMLALDIWAVVRCIRRKRRAMAVLAAAGYLGLIAVVYIALSELIGRI